MRPVRTPTPRRCSARSGRPSMVRRTARPARRRSTTSVSWSNCTGRSTAESPATAPGVGGGTAAGALAEITRTADGGCVRSSGVAELRRSRSLIAAPFERTIPGTLPATVRARPRPCRPLDRPRLAGPPCTTWCGTGGVGNRSRCSRTAPRRAPAIDRSHLVSRRSRRRTRPSVDAGCHPGGTNVCAQLDSDALLVARACEETGLDDLGDIPYQEPLEVLLASLQRRRRARRAAARGRR